MLKRNFCGDGDTVRQWPPGWLQGARAFHKKLFLQCLSATNLHGFHRLQICIVLICCKFVQFSSAARGPKVSKGRPESPLVASAEAKSPEKQKKDSKALSLASPQESCFLWEVSSACGRTRDFPRAGKYPKGAGGGQRVHVSWPPPVPPLLRYSAPLASQGRAQLGSRPFPGRATVAFGAADPSPGSSAPAYPWSVGMGPPQQDYLAAARAAASRTPGKVRARLRHPIGCWPMVWPNVGPDTAPVGRETRGSTPYATRGVRGYPSGRLKGV